MSAFVGAFCIFVRAGSWFAIITLYSLLNTLSAATNDDQIINIGDSVVEIIYEPGPLSVSKPQIRQWVSNAVHAVADFYQGFPVKKLNLAIVPVRGDRIGGTAYRGLSPFIKLSLGENVTVEDLAKDWVVTHELVHLAFPPVHRRHHWIEEGLATYIEPLARIRAGLLDETEAWYWLMDGTPKGLPKAGDKGLDHTPTWGRTYWGGALFCLLADIKIRQRTNNRFALKHALQAIVAAGGTMQTTSKEPWSLAKTLAIGDRAVSVPVLSELYEEMRATPVDVDLDALWQQLGVKLTGKTVTFDDNAPQAALRRALMQ